MTVYIIFTVAGSDTGPFNLYSDVDGYLSPFESAVSKIDLLAGYTSTLVPLGTTIIRAISAGICENYIDMSIGTTSTTTTRINPPCDTLGRASSSTILAYATITNTGDTIITGDVSLSPGTSITGFPPGLIIGTQHITDSTAANAKIDATAAYDCLSTLSPTGSVGADIGGTSIDPGIYSVSSSLAITGTVILNGGGNPDAVFIFQIPSTFIPAVDAIVELTNEAQPCNIYWLVGSSATLSVGSTTMGNIIASSSITINTNATLTGRAFALTGAITMDTNTVISCECTINPCTTSTTTTLSL